MGGRLDEFEIFLAILEHGSLTAAARVAGRSLQAVSRSLNKLEHDLGVQLIQRTTRSLQATPAGRRFERRVRQALADLDAARLEVQRDEGTVEGKLRIGAPPLLASACLVEMLAEFMRRHPAIEVELVLSDRRANLISERLDFALRMGELPDSAMRARQLANFRRVIVAAPGWIARHGQPAHPAELEQLPCVVRSFGLDRGKWPFTIDGIVERVSVNGSFQANDVASCNKAVLLGLGVGLAPYWQVQPEVESGALHVLLEAYEPPRIPFHALWPNSRRLPIRTRQCIDFLAIRFAAVPR